MSSPSPTPTPSNRPAHSRSHSRPPTSGHKQSPFEQQREELVGEIALSLEQVLQNLNRLNRNLEGVIAVGNEFSSVEALWSQFENVMGRDGEGEGAGMGTGTGTGTGTTTAATGGDEKGEKDG